MHANYNKFILSLFLILFGFNLVYSFNVCNVDISEPWFLVTDSSGNDIFIVDDDGDIYFEGIDHSMSNKNTESSLILGGMFFNKVTSNFNSNNFHNLLSDLSSYSGLIIKNNLNETVSVFSNDTIYTKGSGIYAGSQGNCLSDGNYCNGDLVETRDYFCDVTGSKTGSCSSNVVSSVNCANKLSVDSDGSSTNYLTQGTVTDYLSCGGSSPSSSCTSNSYTDSCSGNSLTEYFALGSSYGQSTINCDNEKSSGNYCVGNSQVWHDNWGCGIGSCQDTADTKVQDCSVSATTETSWSCSNNYQRVKTVTSWSPTCSGASCGQTSSVNDVYENAPSGYYCSGGNWALIKNCDGYWNYNSGSCSVSCGGGNYDKSWVTTQSPTIGGNSCPSPSWYNNAGNSCNTQSCCISHYTSHCLGGGSQNGYWFDSCGNQEGVAWTCAADAYCALQGCHVSQNN